MRDQHQLVGKLVVCYILTCYLFALINLTVLYQCHQQYNCQKFQWPVLLELLAHSSAVVAQKFVHSQDALKVPAVHLGAALHMVVAEGARERVAREGRRGKPSSVKLMEGVGAVSILDAQRVPRVALIFV